MIRQLCGLPSLQLLTNLTVLYSKLNFAFRKPSHPLWYQVFPLDTLVCETSAETPSTWRKGLLLGVRCGNLPSITLNQLACSVCGGPRWAVQNTASLQLNLHLICLRNSFYFLKLVSEIIDMVYICRITFLFTKHSFVISFSLFRLGNNLPNNIKPLDGSTLFRVEVKDSRDWWLVALRMD